MAFGAALAPLITGGLGALGVGAGTAGAIGGALSPILVGAGEGAALGGLTGGSPLTGALLGGAGGVLSDITGGFGGLGGGLFGGGGGLFGGGPDIGVTPAGVSGTGAVGTPVTPAGGAPGLVPGPVGVGGTLPFGGDQPQLGGGLVSGGGAGGGPTPSSGNAPPLSGAGGDPSATGGLAGIPGGVGAGRGGNEFFLGSMEAANPLDVTSPSGVAYGGGGLGGDQTWGGPGQPMPSGTAAGNITAGANLPDWMSDVPPAGYNPSGALAYGVAPPGGGGYPAWPGEQAGAGSGAAGGAAGGAAAGGAGGGPLGNLLRNPGSLLTGGVGLMQMMNARKQMNQEIQPLQQALTSTQGLQTAATAPLLSGTLPAGAQQALDTARNRGKAAVRGAYAKAGMSGSTAERQAEAAVDESIAAQQVGIEEQLFQQGAGLAGLQGQEAAQLVNTKMAQDQAYSQALARFVSGLAGGMGGGGGTSAAA